MFLLAKNSGAKKKKKYQCTGCTVSASLFFTPLLVLMLLPSRHDLKAKNLPKDHLQHISFTKLKSVSLIEKAHYFNSLGLMCFGE